MGLGALLKDARASRVDAVLYGHTHQADCRQEPGGLRLLNPGSCGRSRFGGEVTMAVMTVEDGRYQVEKIILTENSEK